MSPAGASEEVGDSGGNRSFWQAIQERREASLAVTVVAAEQIEEYADDRDGVCSSYIESTTAVRRGFWCYFRSNPKRIAIPFGQLVALIAATGNFASFTLERKMDVMAPMFQLFVMYTFLSLHLAFRETRQPLQPLASDEENDATTAADPTPYSLPFTCLRLRIPWWIYLGLSVLDVGAGFILLLSLQFTSLTSVTLLSSLTVPSTMFFSKILLAKSFSCHHFVGVLLCLTGGCLTIWSDINSHSVNSKDDINTETPVPNHSLFHTINVGDLLASTAALLYGLGDAASEYAVKHIDRYEFLGMLGFFGAIITGLQFPFREGDTVVRLLGDPAANIDSLLVMATYVALLFLYYVSQAAFLVKSDATLLNLSLQAQNLWAILFSVVAYHSAPPSVFYLAVALVVLGVVRYEMGPSADAPTRIRVAQTESPEQELEAVNRQEHIAAVSNMGMQYSSI